MIRGWTLSGLLLLLAGAAAQAHDGGGVCAAGTPAVSTAHAALDAAPESLPKRFALADALVQANCYPEAVQVLEQGEALHPRNPELQTKLRNTRSLSSEQSYFAGMEEAEVAARVSRNLLRCSRLGELNTCDEALKLRPDDLQIVLAKADAQLKANKPADAEITLRRARQLAANDANVTAKIAAAQQQRQAALGVCKSGENDTALAACQSALLRGSTDEFDVHSRLAQLHQQRNESAAALASYVAADALHAGDRNVALGIVALTDANPRKDAVTMAARGSALLTLRRGREALAALKQAQTLSPSLPDLKSQIAKAEALARTEPASPPAGVAGPATVQVASVPAPPAPPARRYSNAAEPSRSN